MATTSPETLHGKLAAGLEPFRSRTDTDYTVCRLITNLIFLINWKLGLEVDLQRVFIMASYVRLDVVVLRGLEDVLVVATSVGKSYNELLAGLAAHADGGVRFILERAAAGEGALFARVAQ